MSISMIEVTAARIQKIITSDDALAVELADGRTIIVPLLWYPRLMHASPGERNNWRLIGGGEGMHWPDLDEDISAENIVLGQPSAESQRSFKLWLEERTSQSKQGMMAVA